MEKIKIIISLIAVALTFIAYIPYLKDTFKGKNTPHIFTWFVWGTVTAITYALQLNAGGGVGTWVTLAIVVISFLIFFLGLRNGKKNISRSDIIFLILALTAVILWLVIKQPVFSAALIVLVTILSFIPTIRKSWNKPYSETLSSYELSALRQGLTIFALEQYNIVTWLYPLTWTIINILFSLMLFFRRRQVNNK